MDDSFGFPWGGYDDGQLELPPGFRFHPTDEELVTHYLSRKAADHAFSAMAVGEVDLNKCEPWDLPWRGAKTGEKDRYFFCVRDRKYPAGLRTNRATDAGYWKATGKDKEVRRGKTLVGRKKTLVFYGGRAPRGERTSWVMHEYRLDGSFSLYNKASKNEWVICRVFQKGSSSAAAAGGGSGGKNVPCLQARTRSSTSSDLLPRLTGFPFPGTGSKAVGATPTGPGVAHVTCFSNAAGGHRSHEALMGCHSSSPLISATARNPSSDASGKAGLVQPLQSHVHVVEEGFSKAQRQVGRSVLPETGPPSGINPEISSSVLSNHGVSRQHWFYRQAKIPSGPSGNLLLGDCVWNN